MESIFGYVAESPTQELSLVFATVFVVTYLFCRQWLKVGYNSSGNVVKLPPVWWSLPIVGSLPFLPKKMQDLVEFCISPSNKLGKIFSLRLGPKCVVFISGKKAIIEALVVRSVDFADRPEVYASWMKDNPSKGIAFAHYDSQFRSHHQLCLSILKRFGFGQRVMETRILMEVEEMINKVRDQQDQPFDPSQLTTSSVANILMNMLFGHRFDHLDPTFRQLISDIHEVATNYSLFLQIFPALRFLPYYKRHIARVLARSQNVSRFLNDNAAACIEEQVESFVNYYVEVKGPEYDREQLKCTLKDLVAAGMETTANFIRWAIVLLTNHVSVQERLHSEIDSVIDRQKLPTLDDRSRLPYVEAVILELLRYKTLVPLAVSHCTLNDTEVAGYFIPRGTTVMFNLYSAHMDPDDWQQPQQFRPERFLDQSGSLIHRDKVIAFSLGKRSCLGEQLARQEIFLFLVSLLQNFDFKPPQGQDYIDVNEEWGVSLMPSAYEVRMVVRKS